MSASRGVINRLYSRLGQYPNVVAVGHGVKITKGKVTGERCLSIFVTKKRSKAQLAKHALVPTEVRVGNRLRCTDIVEFGRFRRQGVPTNYPFGDCLSDTLRNGTRTFWHYRERNWPGADCHRAVSTL